MMGLPLARQAKRLRAKDLNGSFYFPGLNDWAFLACAKHCTPYQCSMDGTRVVRTIELYNDQYLVGESFSPDVRAWPAKENLPVAESWKQVRDYILSVRSRAQYAAEAYSFDLVDTTGKLPDVLVGSIPESTSGVTASHIYAIMLEVEKRAMTHSLSLTGHCTDSASNSLKALLQLATPTDYLVELGVTYLGLSRPDFFLFAPFFRSRYPSIAYPCWDHSGRTVLRNLMSNKRDIIAESDVTITANLHKVVAASVRDLHHLKVVCATTKIKHGDVIRPGSHYVSTRKNLDN